MTNPGLLLRRERVSKRLSLRKAAAALGLSPSFLNFVETKGQSFSEETARKLAALYELDLDELLAMYGKLAGDLVRYVLANPHVLRRLRGEHTKAGKP